MGGRGLGDRHLLADQLQPDLVLLRRGQEPLRAPAGTVGPTVGFGHDRILQQMSENPDELINWVARSHAVWVTLATQELYQLPEGIRKTLLSLGNVVYGRTLGSWRRRGPGHPLLPLRPALGAQGGASLHGVDVSRQADGAGAYAHRDRRVHAGRTDRPVERRP